MARRELVAFGRAVRIHRKRLDLSQEKLAELANLDRTYIGGIERGERNVGVVNVYRVARALRVRPSELFAIAEASRSRDGGPR